MSIQETVAAAGSGYAGPAGSPDLRQHVRPYEALGFAVVEQAVEDLKALQKFGIVTNGECVRAWPSFINRAGRKQPMKFLGQYNSKATVDELLHFFRNGGMKAMLAALQSDIDSTRVLKRLRLEANQENASGEGRKPAAERTA